MPQTPSAIPVGSQFSPDLVELREFLQALLRHDGNKAAMEAAVGTAPVRIKAFTAAPTPRQRSLPIEAAVQYGLLEPKTYRVTDVARDLASLDAANLTDEFARHILRHLGGLRVVEGAQQMKLDGLAITGDTLARYLTQQGFRVTEHNTAINSLRMWLALAGVFVGRGWDVDARRKAALLGLDDAEIAALVTLSDQQRAFVIALCRLDPSGDYPATAVRDLAEANSGLRFGRSSLSKDILEPLAAAGLVSFKTGGTSSGKTSTVATTAKFRAGVLEPFLANTVESLDAALTSYYLRAPADIYADLQADDTDKKGRALEAYAVHVMRLLGLQFVGWRKRARETTGRAEVDVVMAGLLGGFPTRWQVQCKNTPKGRVDLEDVAKEVGLLPLTGASHIMVLANCRFTADATTYAHEVMRRNPVSIYLVGDKDYERIRRLPGEIGNVLKEQSAEIAKLRPSQSLWTWAAGHKS